MTLTLETRPIFAIFHTTEGGKEYVPVIAWAILPNTMHPRALVIPPKSVTGYGAALAYPEALDGFERLEYVEPESRVIVPVKMNGNGGAQSFVACPDGEGGEHNVHEWKLWEVALATETEGESALSYRRWTETGRYTRLDIKSIILRFHEYYLCTKPAPRDTTRFMQDIRPAHFITLVARITKSAPPVQLLEGLE